LLPGLLNDARLWQHQIAGLADIASATVADLTVTDSISALASSVLARAPEHFAMAGLSMGGYVALEIMRQAPERVSALALLDTNARPDAPESTENRRRLMQLAGKNFQAVIDSMVTKLVHPDRTKDKAIIDLINAMATDNGKDAFVRQQQAIIGRPDSRPSLKKIKVPTLILCGREDAITPIALHEEMAAGIPDAQLTIVENCGHLSAIERPTETTQALKRWLLDGRES
jgi:pimeloyl-ACP methyl ester carboxylesterase